MATTTQAPTTRLRRVLRFPLVWLLAGVVGIAGVAAVTTGGPPVLEVVGAAAAVVVYRLVMRYLARRAAPELAATGAVPQLLLGIVLGVVLIGVAALAIATEFSFTPGEHNPATVVGTMAAVSIGAAVTEELIFRGLLLQALERLFGSWAALATTALLFGLMHLGNPGATLWSSFAIAVEAGVLLGAAFLWRRGLWLAIGLHFAWNTAVGLFGIAVSGHESAGLLVAEPIGPTLLTGGDFGIEASIVPVALSLLLAVPMLIAARRRGNLVTWRRG